MTARKEPGDDFQPAAAPTKRGGVTEDEKGVRRDGYGRYMLPECTVGKARKQEVPFTRATTFAKSISDTYALSMWQQRMTAIGIAKRQDLRLAAATLHPTKDKDALNGVVEQAKEAAAAKSAARIGSAVHAFTEAADRGEELDAQEYAGHVDAYTERLTEFGLTIVPDMIERIVVWNKFSIAGTFDRVAYWQGRPIVLDLKTGRDLQYGWNEIAIQLCIYANADGVWNPEQWRWEPMPDGIRKDKALVVHLPVLDGGEPAAHIYEVDLLSAKVACQLCYDVRDWRKTRGLATELEPPAPGKPSTDYAARLAACSSDGELRSLWSQIGSAPLKDAFARKASEIRELAG
jgi:hypothetical protein